MRIFDGVEHDDQRGCPGPPHQILDTVLPRVLHVGDHTLMDAAPRLPGKRVYRQLHHRDTSLGRQRHERTHALPASRTHAELSHAAGAQCLEHGIDPVDDHAGLC